MTKDNILFSIIGVLLGVIVGFVFATNIKQKTAAQRPSSTQTMRPQAQDQELPEDHPPLAPNNGTDTGTDPGDEAATLEKARSEPDNFDAQMQAAAVHYRGRRFDEAIALLMHANQLRPDSYEAVVALGNTNFDAARYEIAEKWYTSALVKQPKDVNVRTDLGLTYMFREPADMDRAIKEFRRSLEVDPNHEQTLQNLVVALTKKGSLAEAEAMLSKLTQVNPENTSLTKLRGDIDAARATSSKQPGGASKSK